MLKLFACLKKFVRKLWVVVAPMFKKYVFPAIDIAFAIRVAIDKKVKIYDAIIEIFGESVDVDEKIKILASSIRGLSLGWRCEGIEDDADCVDSFINSIRMKPPIIINAAYREIAKGVLRSTYDKPLKNSQADTIVQVAYTFKKENLTA